MAFAQVRIQQAPARSFVVCLFTGVPFNRTFGVVRPCFQVVFVDFLQAERFFQPSRFVPVFQYGVNRIAKMEGWRLWLLDFEHVAIKELQPALQIQ